jgi:hypothetical protein
VDTNSRLDSVLALSSVNLPGGELRRRSAEDELSMRRYLQEGDIISAEVRARGSVPDTDPRVFGLPDPDPLVRGMDQNPALDPDPDLSISMQK